MEDKLIEDPRHAERPLPYAPVGEPAAEQAAPREPARPCAEDPEPLGPGRAGRTGPVAPLLALIAAAAAVLALSLAVLAGSGPNDGPEQADPPVRQLRALPAAEEGAQPEPGQAGPTVPQPCAPSPAAEEGAQPEHAHSWEPDGETVSHAARTREIVHDAVWEPRTALHTVCNTCLEPADGATDEHEALTGHASFTTRVPITSDVKTSEEWVETVVEEEAYDEYVQTGWRCAVCGERRGMQGDAPSDLGPGGEEAAR